MQTETQTEFVRRHIYHVTFSFIKTVSQYQKVGHCTFFAKKIICKKNIVLRKLVMFENAHFVLFNTLKCNCLFNF